MPVTDHQVEVLRQQLLGNFEEHARLRAQMDDESASTGYVDLVNGAFAEAVSRRFTGAGRSEVIDWVAEIRATKDAHYQINPDITERLILTIFKQATVRDLDFEERIGHQLLILYFLINEENLDDNGLDEFLASARQLGNELAG